MLILVVMLIATKIRVTISGCDPTFEFVPDIDYLINSYSLTSNSTYNSEYLMTCRAMNCSSLCCYGNSLCNLTCGSNETCSMFQNEKTLQIFMIVAQIYFSILLAVGVLVFTITFILSMKFKTKLTSLSNAVYLTVVVYSFGFIIPILIILILNVCFKVSLTNCFKPDFEGFENRYLHHAEVLDKNKRARDYNSIKSTDNRAVEVTSNRNLT